jgi:hypothetical protein
MCVADDYLFLKCFNFDTPLCLKVDGNNLKGVDVSREMLCKGDFIGVGTVQAADSMEVDQGAT